jgi:hypothetical protein
VIPMEYSASHCVQPLCALSSVTCFTRPCKLCTAPDAATLTHCLVCSGDGRSEGEPDGGQGYEEHPELLRRQEVITFFAVQ